MKYGVSIGGQLVWLSQDQLTGLADLLHGAHQYKDEYVGSGKGDDGGNYVKLIKPFDLEENLTVKTMVDDRYGALVLKTKLYIEGKQ